MQGVLSLSWSPHDTSMLLSSGKDGKAFLWDMAAGQALGNATISDSWAHDIAWAPTIPGVFAVSSSGQEGTSGKVGHPLPHSTKKFGNSTKALAKRMQSVYRIPLVHSCTAQDFENQLGYPHVRIREKFQQLVLIRKRVVIERGVILYALAFCADECYLVSIVVCTYVQP